MPPPIKGLPIIVELLTFLVVLGTHCSTIGYEIVLKYQTVIHGEILANTAENH